MTFEELKPFFNKFRSESDRACAILAVALLDSLLEDFFRNVLSSEMKSKEADEIFSSFGPLSTFSAKISLAFGFGLISQNEYNELTRVRKIRNDFAHAVNHDLAFGEQRVKALSLQLEMPDLVTKFNEYDSIDRVSQEEVDDITNRPRRRFEVSVAILAYHLDNKIASAKRCSPPFDLLKKVRDLFQPPNTSHSK